MLGIVSRCQRPGRSTTLLLLVVVSPDAIHLALICWWRVESACYCRSCNWTSGHAGGESCACILHLTFLDLRLWCVNKAVDPRLCAGHVLCSWLFNRIVWRHIDMSWLISWHWNLTNRNPTGSSQCVSAKNASKCMDYLMILSIPWLLCYTI